MTLDPARLCGIGDEAAAATDAQLRLHRQLGLAGVELRTLSGRRLHQLDKRAVESLARALVRHGLEVPVVDTPIGGWDGSIAGDLADDLDLLEVSARHAARLGCRHLRVMSYPNDGRPPAAWRAEAIRRIGSLTRAAERLGVTLLHENCVGWAGQSAETTLDLLREVDSKHLQLVFDLGNGAAYGYDSVVFLAAVLPWVAHVHVKDARLSDAGPVWVPPGEGVMSLPACLELLHGSAFSGWLSLEPHVAHVPHRGVTAADHDLAEAFAVCTARTRALVERAQAGSAGP